MFSTSRRTVRLRENLAATSSVTIQTIRHRHDFPFKPPPIRQRLRPLIPFFIWWSIITSLTVHLLRARQADKEARDRSEAKISVLQALLGRVRAGDKVDEEEVQRELEMVGLRERERDVVQGVREEVKDVGWREAIFGRAQKGDRKAEDGEDMEDWARAVVAEVRREEGASTATTPVTTIPPNRPASSVPGIRRAPSSSVYM